MNSPTVFLQEDIMGLHDCPPSLQGVNLQFQRQWAGGIMLEVSPPSLAVGYTTTKGAIAGLRTRISTSLGGEVMTAVAPMVARPNRLAQRLVEA